MDNFEYLKHISQSNRPSATSTKFSNINGKLISRILIGGILLTVILIVFGTIINTGSSRATDLTQQLYTRISNVNRVINEYNKRLKSPQLRSIGYSLNGNLTSTASQLSSYIASTGSSSDSSPTLPKNLAEYEANMNASINGALENARLNGILDRIYASQIHTQVSLMLSLTSEILARDDDPKLHEILGNFYNNLHLIEQTLNNYSNPSE